MKRMSIAILFLLGSSGVVLAHDLFLKLDIYALAPRARARVWVFNGTFEQSEAAVARARVVEITLLTPIGRQHVPVERWREVGARSLFEVETEEAGTYVAGVALAPREITLTAEQFNAYLEHEGLSEMLAWRRQKGELQKGARERYAKYAKVIFQVGERRTDAFRQPLGYPVEIVLEEHPLDLQVGGVLRVRCLKDGRPLPQQVVFAGWEGAAPLRAQTDAEGIARFEIKRAGTWYVKFIHMVPVSDSHIEYQSWWATLTFEIAPGGDRKGSEGEEKSTSHTPPMQLRSEPSQN